MGYYSDVAYAVRGKKEEVVAVLTSYRLTYPKPEYGKQAIDECNYATCANGDIIVSFIATSTKWYEEFDDVMNHMMLFRAFAEAAEVEGSTLYGNYSRLGEDNADVIEESFGDGDDFLVNVSRTVTIDTPGSAICDSLENILK